jgi:DNA ligase-1
MIESLVSDEYIQETYDANQDVDIRLVNARLVGVDDTNIQEPWLLPLLLGKDVNGNNQRWQIGFDGTQLITQYGRVGGALQTTYRDVTTNTSGRNIYEQSFLEGKRRYLDKCLEGYHTEGTNPGIAFEPMLAAKYDFDKNQLAKWPAIYFQPKIDGVRCLISNQPNGISKSSRKNRVYPHLKHLDSECKLLLSVLPPGTLLDGELYNHEMEFEEITSIVRRTVNVRADEYKIQYWLFDLVTGGNFEERYVMLYNAYNSIKDKIKYLILVPNYQLDSKDQILPTLDAFMNIGYEGLVLRKTGPKTDYIMGRTSNLLKVKRFETSEGYVIAVTKGTGTENDCADFILYDPKLKIQFDIRPGGSFEQRRYWLQHPEVVLNKLYTYKYFSKGINGAPRFPTGVGFRDYE